MQDAKSLYMNLSERRRSDRETMAVKVAELAAQYGFVVSRCDILSDAKNIYLEIHTARGLCASLHFNGENPPRHADTFMVNWHFTEAGEAQLNPAYWPSVNTCHYRKATSWGAGFNGLVFRLSADLEAVRNGSAFAVEPTPASRATKRLSST